MCVYEWPVQERSRKAKNMECRLSKRNQDAANMVAPTEVAGDTSAMSEYADISDEQLIALEEVLYDDEVDGIDTWFERDQVLWEMNRRGMMD